MIQGAAIRVLSYYNDKDAATFTELCSHAEYPTDLGAYYIRQLVQAGYLEKIKRGTYRVTVKGKKQLIELTSGKYKAHHHSRTRLIILFVGKRGDTFVCLRRSAQPFIGKVEWPGGESETGESLQAAAARLMQDRLGLDQTTTTLHSFFRRIDTYKGAWFDDKLFALHTYEFPPSVKLPKSSPRGELIELSAPAILSLKGASRSLVHILRHIESGDAQYEEHIYELKPTDLHLAP